MKAKPNRPETFADILNEVEQTPVMVGEGWSSPIGDREWCDEAGTRWHRREVLVDAKQVRRLRSLFKRPEVRVIHFEDGETQPSEVSGSARNELWTRIEESFQSDPPGAEFHLGRFRDDHSAVLVMVVEFCC